MDTNTIIENLSEEGLSKKMMPSPYRQMELWLAFIGVWLVGFCLFGGLRSDLENKFADSFYLMEIILLSFTALTAAQSTFYLSRPDEYQKPWLKFISIGFLVSWIVVAYLENFKDISQSDLVHSIADCKFKCSIDILIFSLPPSIFMFWHVKKGATVRCYWEGAMATLSTTSLAYVMMRLVELNDDPVHLLVWHVIPVFLICLTGVVAGRLFLKWK